MSKSTEPPPQEQEYWNAPWEQELWTASMILREINRLHKSKSSNDSTRASVMNCIHKSKSTDPPPEQQEYSNASTRALVIDRLNKSKSNGPLPQE